MQTKKRPAPLAITALALATLAALAAPLAAQPADDYGDVQQTVARVAYFTGTVSYNRGDDPDDWQPAGLNFPMTLGDRIYTGSDSRLELQLAGATLYLAPRTDLAALNLTRQVRQLSIGEGLATFRVRSLREDEAFEVDTPNSAVTFDGPGEYRIQVEADGTTRVSVQRGSALVAAAGGEVPVRAGDLMEVVGIDAPTYDVYRLPRRDSWDVWVESRARRLRESRAVRYVSNDVFGADDLDEYGRWEDIPEYGSCWSPSTVTADWAPYRAGHWVWEDPWGWTWVSTEPWGWAPYHWGRWVSFRSRWFWVPVAPSVRVAVYSPALVAFVGAGGGFSASISIGGGGYVGWFPLAPRDPYVPWWGSRRSEVNVTNVTYVNKTYVTVVNQSTFISGGAVATNVVRDANVVRQISTAAVVHGPIPVVPTRGSLRVSTFAPNTALQRPSAQVLTRAVVTRLAPPPAPPTFEAKASAITASRGAPVAPQAAARLSLETRGGARAVMPIRPVMSEPGRVDFRPKEGRPGVAPPTEVKVLRGRALSTPDRPLVSEPQAATRSESAPAPHIAPGAVVTGPARGGPPPEKGAGPPENRGGPPENRGATSNQPIQDRGRVLPTPRGGPPPERNAGPPENRGGPPEYRGRALATPPSENRGGPPENRGGPPEYRGRALATPPSENRGGPPPESRANQPLPERVRPQPTPEGRGGPPPERHVAPPENRGGPPPERHVAPPENRGGPPPEARGGPPPQPRREEPKGKPNQPTGKEKPKPTPKPD